MIPPRSKPDEQTHLPADYKDRQSERKELNIPTRLTQQNWSTVEIVVNDISKWGFMASCPQRVPIGSYVAMEVPGLGAVRAQIRWQVGSRMGGQFLDPIRLGRCEWTSLGD